jgi:alkaline phosphatase D
MKIIYCLSLILLVTACGKQKGKIQVFKEPVSSLYDPSQKPFYHGVASGDPLQDRVILWTRVTPNDSSSKILVKWEISETPDFKTVTKSDTITTSILRDFTVKVDAIGLQPKTKYYYRFHALDKTSPTGETKTLGQETDSLKLAIVSCANWEWGFFNPYSKIADRKEIDAVIHLGDFLYETASGKYGDTTIGRINIPRHEIVSLSDYRTRYSQYRLDAGLKRISVQHPMIAIWDDHEIANNSYTEGAQNHQPEEGDYQKRKEAARQAYYEWIPIRESQPHYRKFSFGKLVDLVMLDERLAGRVKQVDSISDPSFESEKRSMLGEAQLQWLEGELKNSASTWRIIGNQVPFSDLQLSAVFPTMPKNFDSWDGYPAEKKKLKNFIIDNKIKDLIFVTGDMHSSWAIEAATDVKTTYKPFAVELVTTSVSSANADESKPVEEVKKGEEETLRLNPHVKFFNNRDHGYLLLNINASSTVAQWWYVETLRLPDSKEYLGKSFIIKKGNPRLQ